MELHYSRPGSLGTGIELAIGEATLTGVAPGTGGWDQWNTITVGTIELREGAGQTLTLKAVDSPSPPIINFVSLKLRPVD